MIANKSFIEILFHLLSFERSFFAKTTLTTVRERQLSELIGAKGGSDNRLTMPILSSTVRKDTLTSIAS